MKILICVDDTDDLTKETSTGKIANSIKKKIEKDLSAKCEGVTRHQLLIHEDVPYTSHNSAMCFRADIEKENYEQVISISKQVIKKNMAESSAPGLCIVIEDELKDKQLLIDYGFDTKKIVIKKEEAYDLAEELGVFLEELGGTGQGIVGALAGIGLRLSGEDGEFRGRIKLKDAKDNLTVLDIKEKCLIDEVRTLDRELVKDDERVGLGGNDKVILRENKRIFYVKKHIKDGEEIYIAISREEIRNIDDITKANILDLDSDTISKYTEKAEQCSYYEIDVEEEQVVDIEKNCLNCLYRRWEADGIQCQKLEGERIV